MSTLFKEIKIQNRIWMSENLNTSTFKNGDEILEIKKLKDWSKAINEETPAFCYYEFKASNEKKYGKLYNWFAIIDSRGLAPEGWSIAGDKDWSELIDLFGKKSKAGTPLKSKTGWESFGSNKDSNGTNESGFNIVPAGYIMNHFDELEFMNEGFMSQFWTNTLKKGSNSAYTWLFSTGSHIERSAEDIKKEMGGFSVRCIKL